MRRKTSSTKSSSSKNHALAAVGLSALLASSMYGVSTSEQVYADDALPNESTTETVVTEDVKPDKQDETSLEENETSDDIPSTPEDKGEESNDQEDRSSKESNSQKEVDETEKLESEDTPENKSDLESIKRDYLKKLDTLNTNTVSEIEQDSFYNEVMFERVHKQSLDQLYNEYKNKITNSNSPEELGETLKDAEAKFADKQKEICNALKNKELKSINNIENSFTNLEKNISESDIEDKSSLMNEINEANKNFKDQSKKIESKKDLDKLRQTANENINAIESKATETLIEQYKNNLDNESYRIKEEIDEVKNLTEKDNIDLKERVDELCGKAKKSLDLSNPSGENKPFIIVLSDLKNVYDEEIVRLDVLTDAQETADKNKANEYNKYKDEIGHRYTALSEKISESEIAQTLKDELRGLLDEANDKEIKDLDACVYLDDFLKYDAQNYQYFNDVEQKLNQYILDSAKQNAITEINRVSTEAKSSIEGMTLYPPMRDSYLQAVNNDANNAIASIQKHNTSSEINEEVETVKSKIEETVSSAETAGEHCLANSKHAGLGKLTTKATPIKEAIDKSNLQDEIKIEYQEKLQNLLSEAEHTINGLKSLEAISQAQKASEQQLDQLDKSVQKAIFVHAKDQAKATLSEFADQNINLVKENKNLTTDERDAFVSQISSALEEGLNSIEKASPSDDIDGLLNSVEARITKHVDVANAKGESNLADTFQSLESFVKTQMSDLDKLIQNSGLSDKSIKGYEDDLKSVLKDIESILKSDSHTVVMLTDELQKANTSYKVIKEKLEQEIEKLATAKADTKRSLEDLADEQKQLIENELNLSDNDKQLRKGNIDALLVEKKNLVDTLKSVDEINAERPSFEDEIKNEAQIAHHDAEENLKSSKLSSLEEIIKYQETLGIEIANSGLSDDDIDELNGELKNVVQDVTNAINSDDVKAITEVDSKAQDAKTKIEEIDNNLQSKKQALANAKDAASLSLKEYSKDRKSDIEKLKNISSKEREDFISSINDALADFKTGIDKARSLKDVESINIRTQEKIRDILSEATEQDSRILSEAKNQAIENLSGEVEDNIDSLIGMPTLTKGGRRFHTEHFRAIESEYKEKINECTVAADIPVLLDKALNELQFDMRAANTLAESYLNIGLGHAKENIGKVITRIDNLINKSDLDEATRKTLSEELNHEKEKAETLISQEKSFDNIDAAEIKALQLLETYEGKVNESILKHAQDVARDYLVQEGENVKKAIEESGLSDLVIEEFNTRLDGVIKTASEDLKDTDKASTLDMVEQVKLSAEDELNAIITDVNNAISELNESRETAVKNVKTKASKACENIEANQNLSDIERHKFSKDINDKLNGATQSISSLKKISDINDAERTTGESIEAIVDSSEQLAQDKLNASKENACNHLKIGAEFDKEIVDHLFSLKPEQKDELTKKIDESLQASLEEIASQNTIAEIEKTRIAERSKLVNIAQHARELDCKNVNEAKLSAKSDIEQQDRKLTSAIDASGLSDKIMAALKDNLAKIVKQATDDLNVVDKPISLTTIENIQTHAEIQITALNTKLEHEKSLLDEAKTKASGLIEDAYKAASEAVSSNKNLTSSEQEDFAENINNEKTIALAEVVNTRSVEDAQEAGQTGKESIDSLALAAKTKGNSNYSEALEATKNKLANAIESAKSIDGMADLTQEQKAEFKAAVEKVIKAAQQAVEESKTVPQVLDAGQMVQPINEIVANARNTASENLAKAKSTAYASVKESFETLDRNIKTLPNIYSEIADMYNEKAEIAQKRALKNIDSASSIKEVNTWVKGAQQSADVLFKAAQISNLQLLNNAQKAAQKVVADKAEEAVNAIDSNPNLSEEEKVDFAGRAVNKAEEFINKIYKNQVSSEVFALGHAGHTAVDEILGEAIETSKANLVSEQKEQQGNVETAAQKVIEHISNLTNLRDAERENYRSEIDNEKTTAIDAIAAAVTCKEANSLAQKAIDNINDLIASAEKKNLDNLKLDFISELQKKTNKLKTSITESDLPEQSKAELHKKLETLSTESSKDITNAQTVEDVQKHLTEADQNLTGLSTKFDEAIEFNNKLNEAKTSAHKALGDAVVSAHRTIDACEFLSDVQKEEFKATVLSHQKDATPKISSVVLPENAEQHANSAIGNIKNTLEEVDRANQANKNALEKAIKLAIEAIEAEVDNAQGQINELAHLSLSDTKTFTDEVDAKKTAAVEKIKNADTADNATKLAAEGVGEIESVLKSARATNAGNKRALDEAQNAAKVSVDEAVASAKSNISKLTFLSDAQAETVNNKITEAKKSADEKIEAADIPLKATSAGKGGVSAIEKIVEDAKSENDAQKKLVKDARKTALEKLASTAAAARDEISALENLSEAELAEYIAKIEASQKSSEDDLGNADNVRELDTLVRSGIQNIEKIIKKAQDAAQMNADEKVLLNEAKNAAHERISSAKDTASATISELEYVSQAEKNSYSDSLDKTQETADFAIDAADTIDGIESASTDGLEKIDSVVQDAKKANTSGENILATAKKNAVKSIDEGVAKTSQVIDELSSLSSNEAELFKDRINALAKIAKSTVENVEVPARATKIAEDTIDDFNDVLKSAHFVNKANSTKLEEAKKEARKAIEDASSEVEDKLSQLDSLTYEGRDALLGQFVEPNNAAQEAIDKARSTEEIKSAVKTHADKMKEIMSSMRDLNNKKKSQFEESKVGAKKELNTIADAAKVSIENLTNLNKDEKVQYTDKIDKVCRKFVLSIDDLMISENPDEIVQGATTAINNVVKEATKTDTAHKDELDSARNKAHGSVKDAKKNALDMLHAMTNLAVDVRDVYAGQIHDEHKDAAATIQSAQSVEHVSKAVEQGVANINEIVQKAKAHAAQADVASDADAQAPVQTPVSNESKEPNEQKTSAQPSTQPSAQPSAEVNDSSNTANSSADTPESSDDESQASSEPRHMATRKSSQKVQTPATADVSSVASSGFMAMMGSLISALGIKSKKRK